MGGYIEIEKQIKDPEKTKMSADFMKTKVLEYFRFKRRFPFCCTEGIRQADVNACNESKLIEVEVKISKADLKREFNDKQNGFEKMKKHQDYLNPAELKKGSCRFYSYAPNLFYLAIPDDLIKVAEEEIERVNPKYGIIIVYPGKGLFGDNIRMYRHAQPLHKAKPDEKTVMAVCQRCTNELITLRQKGIK